MQGSNCGILDVQVAHKAMNHGSYLQRAPIIYQVVVVQQWRISAVLVGAALWDRNWIFSVLSINDKTSFNVVVLLFRAN